MKSRLLHRGSSLLTMGLLLPQAMLIQLFRKGPYTVGIFRKSANARVVKEIKEKLDSGLEVSDSFIRYISVETSFYKYRTVTLSSEDVEYVINHKLACIIRVVGA